MKYQASILACSFFAQSWRASWEARSSAWHRGGRGHRLLWRTRLLWWVKFNSVLLLNRYAVYNNKRREQCVMPHFFFLFFYLSFFSRSTHFRLKLVYVCVCVYISVVRSLLFRLGRAKYTKRQKRIQRVVFWKIAGKWDKLWDLFFKRFERNFKFRERVDIFIFINFFYYFIIFQFYSLFFFFFNFYERLLFCTIVWF